jgi:alkanesulfonate monooxygenase SsuD/methylene tetrahydromethanopterin reductase-like flavin-dependent oxidoreductase (luciferase family)
MRPLHSHSNLLGHALKLANEEGRYDAGRMSSTPELATDLLLDPFGADWQWMRATALDAEAAGFDGVWTWDHMMGGVHGAGHVLESWTILTGLAAITQSITIGPLTLNVANRYPGLVAVMAATLQQVSGGRLLLGLGAGGGADTPYAAEQSAFARRTPGDVVRRQQVEEAVGVLRQVWSGRARTLAGDYFRLGEGSGFLRPNPAPPIIIGAFGPKMAQLAGRVGDGINTQAQHPRLAQLLDMARREHAASGRATPFSASVFAGFSERWLDESRPERSRLRELGIERLILIVGRDIDTRRLTLRP